jgi:hypothetical protein
MRTVFLAVPAGHNVANLLRGSFLPTLVAQTGLHVVILSPFSVDPRFTAEFERPRVSFEVLRGHRPGRLERIADSVLSERFLLETSLTAPRLQRDRDRLLNPWGGRRVLAALKGVAARLPVSRSAWFRTVEAWVPRAQYSPLFAKYRPSLVVTATAGFLLAEVPLIAAARTHGVPTVAADLGWDNLSSKYRPLRPVDFLIVWNDTMRDEAVRYHGYAPDRVAVAGAAQFDPYFRDEPIEPREEFLCRIGADPTRKLVTLATPPNTMYPAAGRLVEMLAATISDGGIGPAAQLLVRVHPRDDLEAYRTFRDRPHLRIEKPVAHMQAVDGIPAYDVFAPTRDDRRHLAATLAHSDVLVNFASTTTIEACIFDTPVVNVGFDNELDLPLPLSIRRYYTYEHYRPIVELGAARVAAGPEALIAEVRRYLSDPARDRAARRAVVESLCGLADARAGTRVAEHVLELLRRGGARRAVA